MYSSSNPFGLKHLKATRAITKVYLTEASSIISGFQKTAGHFGAKSAKIAKLRGIQEPVSLAISDVK